MAASKGLTQVTQVGHRNLSSSAQGLHSNLVWSDLLLIPPPASSGPPWRSQTLPVSAISASQTVVKTSTASEGALQVRSDPPAEQLSLKFNSLHKVCSRLPSFTPFLSSAPLKPNSGLLCACPHFDFCQVCPTKNRSLFLDDSST